MKVKFLTSGAQAHITHGGGGRDIFEYTKGETMSGLSEDTARSMVKNKHAIIIGEDDPESEVSGDADGGSNDTEPKSDSDNDVNEVSTTNDSAPWDK